MVFISLLYQVQVRISSLSSQHLLMSSELGRSSFSRSHARTQSDYSSPPHIDDLRFGISMGRDKGKRKASLSESTTASHDSKASAVVEVNHPPPPRTLEDVRAQVAQEVGIRAIMKAEAQDGERWMRC